MKPCSTRLMVVTVKNENITFFDKSRITKSGKKSVPSTSPLRGQRPSTPSTTKSPSYVSSSRKKRTKKST